MPRDYRNIKMYEKEILELKSKGITHREIGERYGMTKEQIKEFIKRHKQTERKIATGVAIKGKGRPPKDFKVSEEDKIAQLKYIIARKDAKIKRLEMETELMRDFLSLAGRK